MIDRRDLMIGLGGLFALGAAETLRPRRHVDLVGRQTLATILPERFDDWVVDPGMAVLQPPSEGDLATKLYSEILSRGYMNINDRRRSPVMMLATHGAVQSDALQLHRPEACYPAVGFAVSPSRFVSLPIAPGVALPVVQLTAHLGDRVEDILYWTRIGEDFPQSSSMQRSDRLIAALHGIVGDGVLLRFSAIRSDETPEFDRLEQFCGDIVRATARGHRAAIVGTPRAAALA